ncbi:MAG TPA: hypothetical protein VFR78_03705 [Pyrinomonadaceae bacterium]|nr:hypothetical protein [Pyrinomonadaceae bacterium]
MKEITRRLYTKPVMLALALLAGVALVFALFVTSKSTAAPNSFPVAAGNDEFETAGDGETFHDFEGSPIPANFFGQGSLAYAELVPLVGVPLSAGSNVDTVIQRHQTVWSAGGSTALTMTGLSLRSINPITVTYSNQTTETWNMRVGLSAYKTSGGSMTINSSTFDSTLKVWPKFTFTRVSDGAVRELDTGAPTGPGLTASEAIASEDVVISPAPAPTVSKCLAATDSEGHTINDGMASATTSTSCAPVTLTSTNSPWGPCSTGGFCIPVPITEEERWARHRPGPRGTIQKGVAVAE